MSINDYKRFLHSRQLQASTVKNYLWHLNRFFDWLQENKISEAKLKEYHQHMIENHPRINTINLRFIILNDYLKYLQKRFRFELLSPEETSLPILTDDQLQEFLNQPLKYQNNSNLRDKALLELLYSTGLKVGQLVELKREYVDEMTKELILPDGKHVIIKPLAWFHLDKYLNTRHDDSPWLFTNLDRAKKSAENNLTVRSVERIIAKYAKLMTRVLIINPQILRNTLAYKLKSDGAQKENIRDSLHFKTKIGADNYLKKI
jgi:integrase/recombinase XerD